MIGLADCNNFFVSCERVFRPDLERRPVLVLSNNDGCVIARSNEVKRMGIKMGVPVFKIASLIKKQQITVFSSNYCLYGDMSSRVMSILRGHFRIEVYSIDEAFLDLSQLPPDAYKTTGERIVKEIRRATGIPVSIGIAPTKTLAKIASHLCKHYPKLNGCCVLSRPEDIFKVLSTLPIDEVWGIGRRLNRSLKLDGIFTAQQLLEKKEAWIRQKMGVVGVRLYNELKGIPCFGIQEAPADRKQIRVSRTFGTEITKEDDLRSALITFAARALEKLRKQACCCYRLELFVETNAFRDDVPYYRFAREYQFIVPTNSNLEVNDVITRLLAQIYHPGYSFKRGGITLMNFVSDKAVQGDLFDTIDRSKHLQLMRTMDEINKKHGRDTLLMAAQAYNPFKAMNRSNLSPEYTTKFQDILIVKV